MDPVGVVIALLCMGKLRMIKNKFNEVLEKAKIKRDELMSRTAVRNAEDLKKETDDAKARDQNRISRTSSNGTKHWN